MKVYSTEEKDRSGFGFTKKIFVCRIVGFGLLLGFVDNKKKWFPAPNQKEERRGCELVPGGQSVAG